MSTSRFQLISALAARRAASTDYDATTSTNHLAEFRSLHHKLLETLPLAQVLAAWDETRDRRSGEDDEEEMDLDALRIQASTPDGQGATRVFTLTIEHRHGTDVTVHRTREAARAALHAYVVDWWEKEGVGGEMPSDLDEAITAYFDQVDGEYHSIGETYLGS
jgi:hypothetical protein